MITSLRARLFPPLAAAPGLASAFDGSASAPAAALALPAGRIRAYLVRAGHETVATTLEELPAAAARAGFAADFNQNGHLRVVVGEGALEGPTLSESDAPLLKEALAAGGLRAADARTRSEVIPLAPGGSAAAATARTGRSALSLALRGAAAAAVAAAFVAKLGLGTALLQNLPGLIILALLVPNLDRLPGELRYVFSMLKAALRESKHPSVYEILGGVAGKIVPALVNLGIFGALFLGVAGPVGWALLSPLAWAHFVGGLAYAVATAHGHYVAFLMTAALSLALETFHGVWVNTWDTFQNKIGLQRGNNYQSMFNLVYGQLAAASFRAITYFVFFNVAAPWTLPYWSSILIMTIVGTICGTLGYRGLNSLYQKGRVPRKGRAGLQQMRDFFMMLVGPFFGTGNLLWTAISFSVMQVGDLIIFGVDQRAKTRPIVYLADERVAASNTFSDIYLHPRSPLRDAVDGVKGFILFKPFVAAYRWARGRVKEKAAKNP
jgi:hypothetical protein